MRTAAVVVAALASCAGAADVVTMNGIAMVNLKQFAQENGLTFTSGAKGMTLRGAAGTVVMFPFSRSATLNGVKFTLSAAPSVVSGQPLGPLADLQRVFRLTPVAPNPPVTTKASAVATSPAPPPATPVAPPPVMYEVVNTRQVSNFGDLFTDYGAEFELTARQPVSIQDIYDTCVTWIREGLKAPSTAIFNKANILAYQDNAWIVAGTADAQNSYGAMMRGDYYCWVRLRVGKLQFYTTFKTRL